MVMLDVICQMQAEEVESIRVRIKVDFKTFQMVQWLLPRKSMQQIKQSKQEKPDQDKLRKAQQQQRREAL